MTNFLLRMSLKYLLFIALTWIAANTKAQANKISFSNNNNSNPILRFATDELKLHLGSEAIQQNQSRFHFSFNKDEQLKNGAFRYTIQHAQKKSRLFFQAKMKRPWYTLCMDFLNTWVFNLSLPVQSRPHPYRPIRCATAITQQFHSRAGEASGSMSIFRWTFPPIPLKKPKLT